VGHIVNFTNENPCGKELLENTIQ